MIKNSAGQTIVEKKLLWQICLSLVEQVLAKISACGIYMIPWKQLQKLLLNRTKQVKKTAIPSVVCSVRVVYDYLCTCLKNTGY